MVKCKDECHRFSRPMRCRNDYKLQLEEMKPERPPIHHHKVVPKLNGKGEGTTTPFERNTNNQ